MAASVLARLNQGDEEEQMVNTIENLLNNPERVTVIHSFSLHAMTAVEGGLRLHIVLKFKYDESLIEGYFGATKPEADVEKRYGEAYRLFPYCIFNSIDEVPLSWTYQNKNGQVYERIELYVTVTFVKFSRYFPFVLKVLNLKVGADGTAKTGFINLMPELNKDGEPNVDFGVFTKKTSDFYIQPDAVQTGEVACRMVVRDLTASSLGNMSGIYTRVYTVFFFEANWMEDFFKFIIVSLCLVWMIGYAPHLGFADSLATCMTCILTQVALFFVIPQDESTVTAELLMIKHILYNFLVTFFVGWIKSNEIDSVPASKWLMWSNGILTVTTLMWIGYEFAQFRLLVAGVKGKFRSVHSIVGSFKDIDEII